MNNNILSIHLPFFLPLMFVLQGLYDDSDCDSAELDHSGIAEPSQPTTNW